MGIGEAGAIVTEGQRQGTLKEESERLRVGVEWKEPGTGVGQQSCVTGMPTSLYLELRPPSQHCILEPLTRLGEGYGQDRRGLWPESQRQKYPILPVCPGSGVSLCPLAPLYSMCFTPTSYLV